LSKEAGTFMQHRYSKLSLFGIDGRLTRLMYFLFSFIIPLSIFWIVSALAGQLIKYNIISENTAFFLLVFSIFIGVFILIRQTIQRSHDFNKSGWLTILLMLFPPFILLFWIIPGDKTVNSYGEPVRPLSTFTIWLNFIIFIALVASTIYLFNKFSILQSIGTWFRTLLA